MADKPPGEHPRAAYFTTLPPSTRNLANRLRIPRQKVEFVFCFVGDEGLQRLEGGRGAYVFYSQNDYLVEENRQQGSGRTDEGVCE